MWWIFIPSCTVQNIQCTETIFCLFVYGAEKPGSPAKHGDPIREWSAPQLNIALSVVTSRFALTIASNKVTHIQTSYRGVNGWGWEWMRVGGATQVNQGVVRNDRHPHLSMRQTDNSFTLGCHRYCEKQVNHASIYHLFGPSSLSSSS